MKSATARFPLQITVVYLLLGGSYIMLSDLLVEHLSGDAVQAAHLQTLKGWGFVLVTALVLFLLLRQSASAARMTLGQGLVLGRVARLEAAEQPRLGLGLKPGDDHLEGPRPGLYGL